MKKYKLEYIWLDGKKPEPGLRGKTPQLIFLPNCSKTRAIQPITGEIFTGSLCLKT